MMGRGQLAPLEQMARSIFDTGLTLRQPGMRRLGAAATGWIVLQEGRIAEAVELLQAGTDEHAGVDIGGVRSLALGGLACAQALAGDGPGARGTVERADAETRAVRVFEPVVELGRAHAAHAEGHPGAARTVLRASLDSCRDAGQHTIGLMLAMSAIDLGAADLALDHLAHLVEVVDGDLVQAAHGLAAATAARDAARLDDASETFERFGFVLRAAVAAAVAGDAHERAGKSRRALAARARARRLLERCPGAHEGFLHRPGPSAVLTAREAEIAAYAAEGLSSVEIAEQLVISVRTVDSHLSRVYLKLGVPGRAELRGHPELAGRLAT
jgi:DNA-binding CsgD family transcriptional regulator